MSLCPDCGRTVAESAGSCPACGASPTEIGQSDPKKPGSAEAYRRRELARRRLIHRTVFLLALGFAILLIVAVAGRFLAPVQSDGDLLADDEFSACMACVEHLQEQGELPEGAVLPSCLLEVGAAYRGEGLYDVTSAYQVPADSGGSVTHEYRCRARRSAGGDWTILDVRVD